MYKPHPINTDDVTLPKEISELIELLAKNNHEIWAQKRMAEGWTYGEERKDALKETQCLVPYKALPESEKEYDRKMAKEALKLIIKLGYSIDKK